MNLTLFLWENYFSGTSPTPLVKKRIIKDPIFIEAVPEERKIYVCDCYFHCFTSTEKGGAIDAANSSILLIESSTFYECKTTSNRGGAINYFNKVDGQCVISKVCGIRCFCYYLVDDYSRGQFSRLVVCNSSNNKNYFNDNSVYESAPGEGNAHETLYLNHGNLTHERNNITNNKINDFSIFVIFRAALSKTAYSFFGNNTDNQGGSIFYTYGTDDVIDSCNFIGNSAEQKYLINVMQLLVVKNSCFMLNNVAKIFEAPQKVNLYSCTVEDLTGIPVENIKEQALSSFVVPLFFDKCKLDTNSFKIRETCRPFLRYFRNDNMINMINLI